VCQGARHRRSSLGSTAKLNEGLVNPTIRARLADVGTISMVLTAAEFGAYVAAESEKWGKVVKSVGIKLQ
jgi:tripartite-type tricarboxylate transporter receptor subunit TctC